MGSKVAISGCQPFYYISNPYYLVHPLMETGGLLHIVDTKNLLSVLEEQNIDYFVNADMILNAPMDKNTPIISSYHKKLNQSVIELLGSKHLEFLYKTSVILKEQNSAVYRVVK